MDATAGIALERLFWIVLAGLSAALVAIVLLVRSGRAVPSPTGGRTHARQQRHPVRPPRG